MKKLFIVGCPRSGTTMLQQALNRHSGIVIPPETAFFTEFLGHTKAAQRRQLRRINEDLGLDVPAPPRRTVRDEDARALYERIVEKYVDRLGRRAAAYFGDKSPHHLLAIRRLHRIYPEAKVILLYRDGRDVALSLTEVPWASPDLYVNFAYWLKFFRYHQWAVSCSTLDLLCIRYEDVVTETEETLHRILAFLGLDFERAVSDGHGNEEGVPQWERDWKQKAMAPIDSSRVAVWRKELSARQAERLGAWGRNALGTLGYECPPGPGARLPLTFLPRIYFRVLLWRLSGARAHGGKQAVGRK